jgi:hypothetical protein
MVKDIFQTLCRNYSRESDSSKIFNRGSLNSKENVLLSFEIIFWPNLMEYNPLCVAQSRKMLSFE